MTVSDLIKEAEALPVPERGQLLTSLLSGLPFQTPQGMDDRVEKRRREMDSGEVADISFDELAAGLDLPR